MQQHAAWTASEIRKQKAKLALYASEHYSCEQLLDFALEKSLEFTDSSVGYILEYNEDARLLTIYAWSDQAMQDCNIIEKQTIFELDKTGLWAEAIRQRRPIITNDYAAHNPYKKGCPEGHINLVRHLNLPIIRDNRIVAVVGVGNKACDYTQDEVRHLSVFLQDIWNMVERRKAIDELVQAKEMAEASSRLKTELLNNLSHELRTPLNGIIGGVQLLQFTELTPEQAEYVEMIEETSANELALVNNLLELVKIEAEGVELEQTPFSLRQCIDEVLKISQLAARDKKIVLHQEFYPNLPLEVVGIRARICQILIALVGNAIKFTDSGSVTVKVFEVSNNAEELKLRIAVEDTGIGITPQKSEKIFEPFVQSDMSLTRRFGGLGLGLPICKRLVSLMGGKIWCESELGKGSCFWLEMPFKKHQETDLPNRKCTNLQILVAEDDYLSCEVAERLLTKMGHKVFTAVNGREAVELWKRIKPDIIFMDIAMPEMTGFDAMWQIRTLEHELKIPKVPVVACTSFVRPNYHESFTGKGFDGYIQKPLKFKELQAIILSCCQ